MGTGSPFLSNSSWNVRVRLFIHVYEHEKVSLYLYRIIYINDFDLGALKLRNMYLRYSFDKSHPGSGVREETLDATNTDGNCQLQAWNWHLVRFRNII